MSKKLKKFQSLTKQELLKIDGGRYSCNGNAVKYSIKESLSLLKWLR